VADNNGKLADAPALRSQEGIMARRDFPLNIDRRRLLATGAAVATAAIALRADRVDAALADTVQLPALTPEVPPLNVCAAAARRLIEIARRNNFAAKQICLCFRFRRNCAA
jgi:hypothetical protein